LDETGVIRATAVPGTAAEGDAGHDRGPEPTSGERPQLVLAHFLDGRSAARAIRDLDASGAAVDAVYVVAAGEAGLLARLGVAATDAVRATAEPTRVVVAVAVADDHAGDCIAVLVERSGAIGVPAAT
jgi:hypothetical protein